MLITVFIALPLPESHAGGITQYEAFAARLVPFGNVHLTFLSVAHGLSKAGGNHLPLVPCPVPFLYLLFFLKVMPGEEQTLAI